MTELLFALIGFVIIMLLGVPLFAAIGMTAVALFYVDDQPFVTLAQIMVERVASPGLIPVPFFVITAVIMQRGGIAQILIKAAESWVGQLPGSAGIVCVHLLSGKSLIGKVGCRVNIDGYYYYYYCYYFYCCCYYYY